MKILADASLPGLQPLFGQFFKVSLYNTLHELKRGLTKNDILVCRSTLKVNKDLLANSSIQCVATASSGIDHIDNPYLQEHGIVLFDAKGSNASAVADYVVACLACIGNPLTGEANKAGIIGVGEVGSRVAERFNALGYTVFGYDPLKKREHEGIQYCSLETLVDCNILCIHANLHQDAPYPSTNLLSTQFLQQLAPGTIIINAARGGIVDENALLRLSKPLIYCTDVYLNEPNINPNIVTYATICTPHIAGHSIEAKYDAVVTISQKIHQFYGYPTFSDSEKIEPMLPSSRLQKNHLLHQNNWRELVLALYNPMTDTKALKNASDKKHFFLQQRVAHNQRHNFTFYDCTGINPQIKRILGQ